MGLAKKQNGKNKEDVQKVQQYMCENYFDVRTFGAVMSTGDDQCGTVRGPVQINFARSIDPVFSQDITITRQAKTSEKRENAGNAEMGRKSIIYYGLYRAEGYISASLAQKVTGFSEGDLELFWKAVINMFENDRSAARGKMCMRKLYVFQHDSILGNAPAHTLFEKIEVKRNSDILVPRKFSDYTITVDQTMPEGVTFVEKL